MGELEDRYGARWNDVLQKRVLDILRNEVRTRHRIAANEEIGRLEPAIRARFQDFTALGFPLELTTFAEIEELLSLSRRDAFKVCGHDDVSRVMNEYEPDAVRPTQQVMDAAVPYNRPATTKTKHAPQEYVSLANEGLNNTEIAERLGDVSEGVGQTRTETSGLHEGSLVSPGLPDDWPSPSPEEQAELDAEVDEVTNELVADLVHKTHELLKKGVLLDAVLPLHALGAPGHRAKGQASSRRA